MRIRMRQSVAWQHVGREHPMTAGETYDVPAAVGRHLVSSGAADVVADGPPETKPAFVQETKRSRRAR